MTWKEQVTAENIVRRARELCALSSDEEVVTKGKELQSEHVIVDWAPVHWGMKHENPIEKVGFYGKYGNTQRALFHSVSSLLLMSSAAMKATCEDLTHLLPSAFGEYHLRVYTREPKYALQLSLAAD